MKKFTSTTNVEVFGEAARPLTEWAADPRCVVPVGTLVDRLSRGTPPEIAMTTSRHRERQALRAWASHGLSVPDLAQTVATEVTVAVRAVLEIIRYVDALTSEVAELRKAVHALHADRGHRQQRSDDAPDTVSALAS